MCVVHNEKVSGVAISETNKVKTSRKQQPTQINNGHNEAGKASNITRDSGCVQSCVR